MARTLTILTSPTPFSTAKSMIWLFLSLLLVSRLGPGRLSNLQVAHHTKRSENNTCEIQLTCSVENPNDNVSFRWQVAGIPYHSETNLSISWDPKSLSEETYTCIAENPVSFLSSSVSDKSVCEGVINGKNEYLDIRWIIIVVVLTCIFFIALIFIFVQRRKVAGFPFFLLLLLSGFRDLESGAVTRLCLAQDR
uniref:Uncharacterized protein n=1 Tax=Ovis aries TaxID=9940 RepID=A0AC11EC96_SHEEP